MIEPNKLLKNLKNETFIKNSKDPNNGNFVKKIWVESCMKGDRRKWDLRWEYYRHRAKMSVEQFLLNNRGNTVKIIYSGDPKQHVMELEKSDGIPKTI